MHGITDTLDCSSSLFMLFFGFTFLLEFSVHVQKFYVELPFLLDGGRKIGHSREIEIDSFNVFHVKR